MLSSPTQGLNFTIRGTNFGTKVDHVEIFLGNMSLKVLSLTFNINIGMYEVRSKIPPMVSHVFRPIRLAVNGQVSIRNNGNPLSSTFFVRSGPPIIRYVDLGKILEQLGALKYLFTALILVDVRKMLLYMLEAELQLLCP